MSYLIKCKQCGKEELMVRSTAVFCSGTCRAKHYVQKKNAIIQSIIKAHEAQVTLPFETQVPIKTQQTVKTVETQVPEILEKGGKLHKTRIEIIGWHSEGVRRADKIWKRYFPNIDFNDVWEDKIMAGKSEDNKYSFEAKPANKAKHDLGGIYIYAH